jgi:KaiC/GvpD/RAD55 family RecA-like ATPase
MGERQGAPPTARMAVSSNLVGRESELARLREAVDAAMMGKGGVLFVVGEPGIGKTRLTQVMLRGRAVQTATPAAYRPLAEALSSGMRAGAVPDAAALGPFRAVLGSLVPEWGTDDQEPLDDSVVAVAEGVLRFLRAIAREHGALLVLEDLQWADPETVTIVEYLADNLAAERAPFAP